MRAGTTARHHALAEPHRARLVELLKATVDAVPVEKLAAEVDLHPNTVRAHLDVLVRAGLVSAETEQSGRPGRPRRLFRALTSDEGEHELLAAALTGSLARAVDGARLAEAAGLLGLTAARPEQVRPMIAQALAHDGPALVEVLVHRQELAMPPSISLEQVTGFGIFMAKAVLSGRGDELIDLAKTNLFR